MNMKTKKAILTTVLLSLSLWCFSQIQLIYETNNHLKFNDIQINGNIDTFTEKLVKQGFEIEEKFGWFNDLEGIMFGKECTVTVRGTEKTKTVYNVSVSFDSEEREWLPLKRKYFVLKKTLETKYGKGTSNESFISPYTEGDGREKEALNMSKINYYTLWKTTGGEIRIDLLNMYCVVINYYDETNSKVYNNEKTPSNNDDDDWY